MRVPRARIRARVIAVLAAITLLTGLATSPLTPAGTAAALPPSGPALTDDRVTSVPTGWRWYTAVSANFLSTTAQQGGYRIVDLEVDSATPTFTARLVPDAGDYQAPGGWWWYPAATRAEVNTLLIRNGARLIDLEGYQAAGGTRYAVVMVRNAGTAGRHWYYRVDLSMSALLAELVANGYRPQQIGSMRIGTLTYRTLIAVRNVGADARSWWWHVNQTHAQVTSSLSTNQARLLNVERVSGSPTYDVSMIREPASFWLWHADLTASQVTAVAQQAGTRVIDIETYPTPSGIRYAVVLLDNTYPTDARARDVMWARYGSFVQWGFYLRQISGPALHGLHHTRPFEPASSIKVLVHFHTNLMGQQGLASTGQILGFKRQDRQDWQNSCPDSSTIAGTQYLGEMDRSMMTQSNNPYTHSLRERFGTANIIATGQTIGLTATSLNHNIGCGTFLTSPNSTTLTDLGKIYERVQLGDPISGAWRTRFLDTMSNHANSDAATSFCEVVVQEAASLGLSASFANSYCGALRTYRKPGAYYDFRGNRWLSQAGLLVLPVAAGGVRAFVYGDYVQKVALRPGESEGQIFAPLTRAVQELARPQLRSALATY